MESYEYHQLKEKIDKVSAEIEGLLIEKLFLPFKPNQKNELKRIINKRAELEIELEKLLEQFEKSPEKN